MLAVKVIEDLLKPNAAFNAAVAVLVLIGAMYVTCRFPSTMRPLEVTAPAEEIVYLYKVL